MKAHILEMAGAKKLKQTRLAPFKRKKNWRTLVQLNKAAKKRVSEELTYSNLCLLIDFFAEGLAVVIAEQIRKDKTTRFGKETVAKAVVKTFEECGYITHQLNNCIFEQVVYDEDGYGDEEELSPTLVAAVERLISGLGEGVLAPGGLKEFKETMQSTFTRRLGADPNLTRSIVWYYEFRTPE